MPQPLIPSCPSKVPVDWLAIESVQQRFREPRPWRPETVEPRIFEAPPVAAAVLMLLIPHADGPRILLTERTAHLRQHPGQISFPGGRHEPHDVDAVATAVRETREEVGIDPTLVEVFGTLPPYLTASNFAVTPVVARLQTAVDGAATRFAADAREVQRLIVAPVRELLDPDRYVRQMIVTSQGQRSVWVITYTDAAGASHRIWGATAAMLRNFYRFLKG
ncbi:MAG: NUDIX hydrolase [Burkholderiaceae bacterium]